MTPKLRTILFNKALAATELLTNPTFASNLTSWGVGSGTGSWSYHSGSGAAKSPIGSGVTTTDDLSQACSFMATAVHKIMYSVTLDITTGNHPTYAVFKFKRSGSVITTKTIKLFLNETTQESEFNYRDDNYDEIAVAFTKHTSDVIDYYVNYFKVQKGTIVKEPLGFKDIALRNDRDEETSSLVEFFESSFQWWGSSLALIQSIETDQGPDATIELWIDVTFSYDYVYEKLYEGLLDVSLLEEASSGPTPYKMKVPMINTDFKSTIVNRKATPVDIQSLTDQDGKPCDPMTAVLARLTPQKVRANAIFNQFKAWDYGFQYGPSETSPDFMYEINENDFVGIDLEDEIQSDITTKNSVAPVGTNDRTIGLYNMEYAGVYDFDIKLNYCLKVAKYGFDPGTSEGYLNTGALLKVFIQINDDDPIEFTTTETGTPSGSHVPGNIYSEYTIYEYADTLTLKKGDVVRIYGKDQGEGFGYGNNTITIFFFQLVLLGQDNSGILWSGQTPPTTPPTGLDSHIYIVADTVYPTTEAEAFFSHDVGAAIVERLSGKRDSFESNYLGGAATKAKQYGSNGFGYAFLEMKGLHIRRYLLADKPFFNSLLDWFIRLRNVHSLGMAFETIDGEEKVVVEELEKFFDDSSTSVDLDNVPGILRNYDASRIIKKVDGGYNVWQAQTTSGIDDPQTKTTWSMDFRRIGTNFSIVADIVTASIAMELTRRQTIEKSKDFQLDNNTFLLAINPTPAGDGRFLPELDENFSDVDNLLNPETRYNYRLWPIWNFIKWMPFFNGALQQKLSSVWKFSGGEGNFDVEGIMDNTSGDMLDNDELISQRQDIPVDIERKRTGYLHLPQVYKINMPMSWQTYKTIRSLPRKAIGISRTNTGHIKCFIKTCKYWLFKSKVELQVWIKP